MIRNGFVALMIRVALVAEHVFFVKLLILHAYVVTGIYIACNKGYGVQRKRKIFLVHVG